MLLSEKKTKKIEEENVLGLRNRKIKRVQRDEKLIIEFLALNNLSKIKTKQ